ncbi:MAG: hypothetical protein N3B10_09940 [Armatimonadetes bacterium]|nr:hypothetical protein [Armatimonadota bacterium]MCX7968788.1 hypothetical protein [Armatimonadota bacterium]MDW8143421.1 hypothetical protein [Armatimonadota bacterium]
MEGMKDEGQGARIEGKDARLASVLVLFGLSLLALASLCLGVVLDTSLNLLVSAALLTAITLLSFWLSSIWLAQPNDVDSVCWEALHQSLVSWRQAVKEQEETRGKSLYEQGKGSLSLVQTAEPNCPQLSQLLRQLSTRSEEGSGWRFEVSYRLGALSAISPFSVPSVRLAIWVQTLWQLWAIGAGILAASVAWVEIDQLPLRALVYAASGGTIGASLYNLRTLADHIAVQRDYSTRFWVDYLTRPFLGAVLGVVVYAFAVGLTWTLTLQSPVGAQMPKVIFALGFLSGYSLRSVLAWLNGIAKSIFRPAPSASQEQQSPPGEQ